MNEMLGCGRSICMGHGEYWKCGEYTYSDKLFCQSCVEKHNKILAQALKDALEEITRLKSEHNQ